MDPLGFDPHDHTACISDAIAAAEETCAARGLHFTPVRKRALEILLEQHRAMGAYEVLQALSQDGYAAQPPVAYRALNFLTEHGFAHRVERLNAFIACAHPGEAHAPTFLICRACDRVAEAAALEGGAAFERAAADAGFAVERMVVEAEGLCPACSGAAA